MIQFVRFYFFPCCLLLSSTFLPAQNIRFLHELPVLTAGSSASKDLVFQAQAVGGRIFFVASDGDQNYELWITDGRPEGTFKLKELNGNDASVPYGFTVLDHRLVFAATDRDAGTELWISDGTRRGTQLLRDINPGAESSAPRRLTALNGHVVFFADNGTNGTELWSTDGTPEGTALLKDVKTNGNTYEGAANPAAEKPLAVIDGKIYFSGRTNTDPVLIQSDGTTAGTSILINAVESFALNPVKLGNAIYFLANSDSNPGKLWKSDLSSAVTTELVAISSFKEPVVLGSKIFFVNSNALWETDGTAAGTKKTAAVTHTNINSLTVFGDKLYVYGKSGSTSALLRFDGNSTVQSLSVTLNTGPEYAPVIVKNKLYAPVQPTATQHSMIFTDGASLSFAFTATAPSSTIPYSVKNLFVFNDELYFSGMTTLRGNELWKINGTNSSVQLVTDANPGHVPSNPQLAGMTGNQFFLFAATGLAGREYWMSQGSADNTRPLGDLNPGNTFANAALDNGTPIFIADRLLLQADSMDFWLYDIHAQTGEFAFRHPNNQDPNVRLEQVKDLGGSGAVLQISNGATDELWLMNATDPAKDIFESPNVVQLGRYGTAPVFSATTASNSCAKLYTYDGADVVPLMDEGSNASCLQRDFRSYSGTNKLYFVSQNGAKNTLWESNGTLAGTHLFLDVASGVADVAIRLLWEFNSELYFIARSGDTNDLWKTNGTTAGSMKIFTLGNSDLSTLVTSASIATLNGNGYFTYLDLNTAMANLVVTNGTEAGTSVVRQFRSTGPYLVATSNRVFFTATTDDLGKELWYTDGTAPGTAALDINPGPGASIIDQDLNGPDIGVLDDQIYFRAYDNTAPTLGDETPTTLWVSNGQMGGTHTVSNNNGEEKFTQPKTFFSYQENLYFSGGGAQHYGLWEISAAAGSLQVSLDGEMVQRERPADWGYIPTNDPKTGTLVIRNNSGTLVTLEDITWDNGEFTFIITDEISELPRTIAPGAEVNIAVTFVSAEKARRHVQVTLATDIVNDPNFVFDIEVMSTEAALVTAKPANTGAVYCDNQGAVFTADPVVNGGFYPLYVWKLNDETLTTTDVPTYTYPALKDGDEVAVTLIPSEDALSTTATVTSASVTIRLSAPSTTTVQISANHTDPVPAGTTVVITAQTINAGLNPSYQWFANDGPLAGETNAALTYTTPKGGSVTLKLQLTPDVGCPVVTKVFSNEIVIDIITGLEDAADLQVRLYPNPAKDRLFITSQTGKPMEATILDIKGIEHGTYYGNEITIKTAGMNDGLYFVRLRAGTGTVVKKVMILRD